MRLPPDLKATGYSHKSVIALLWRKPGTVNGRELSVALLDFKGIHERVKLTRK